MQELIIGTVSIRRNSDAADRLATLRKKIVASFSTTMSFFS
jgi:hypothetical protein